jgi:hypothetical protein
MLAATFRPRMLAATFCPPRSDVLPHRDPDSGSLRFPPHSPSHPLPPREDSDTCRLRRSTRMRFREDPRILDSRFTAEHWRCPRGPSGGREGIFPFRFVSHPRTFRKCVAPARAELDGRTRPDPCPQWCPRCEIELLSTKMRPGT